VFDYGYESVLRSHAESLQRLKVPRVDILLCHDIGRLTHGEQHLSRLREFVDGGYRAMRELRAAGSVRAIGLGVNEPAICVELLQHCELDCILLAGRYTLLEQPALEELLPLCEQRGVSIICGGPFNSGILAAGSRAGAQAHYNYAAPPPAVLERVSRLEAACAEFSVPLQAAALQFPLGHPQSRVCGRLCQCGGGAQCGHHVRASHSA
jgi:D-threo-aldose 1-dehydrogenase